MSYTIIYDTKIVREADRVYLMLLAGDNNVYTPNYMTGRQVRSRDWNAREFPDKLAMLDWIRKLKEDFAGGSIQGTTFEKFYNKVFKMPVVGNSGMFAHRLSLYKSCYSEDKFADIRPKFEEHSEAMSNILLNEEQRKAVIEEVRTKLNIPPDADVYCYCKTLSPELKAKER